MPSLFRRAVFSPFQATGSLASLTTALRSVRPINSDGAGFSPITTARAAKAERRSEMNRFSRRSSTRTIEFVLAPQGSTPIAALSYLPIPFATTHAYPPDCNIRVFRARPQNANACRRQRCKMNADREPCDKTTGRNYPKSALYLVAIACASTFFLRGERTCAGAPYPVSITLARSHVGAIVLNRGLPHFCATLTIRNGIL